MKQLGGYFELELAAGRSPHPRALALNSGRSALALIVKTRKTRRILVPRYICRSVVDSLAANNVEVEFYDVDFDLRPKIPGKAPCTVLLVNYFGILDQVIQREARRHPNCIVDNTQAFFARPPASRPSFYSARKYFGVPDGGFAYLPGYKVKAPKSVATSFDRCSHLLKRKDVGAPLGYRDYQIAEKNLSRAGVLAQSALTRALLASIDFAAAAAKRRENFAVLHDGLSKFNDLPIESVASSVPMTYPLFVGHSGLREGLVKLGIFVPQYWREVPEFAPAGNVAREFASRLVCLPLDQRYDRNDMQRVVRDVKRLMMQRSSRRP